MNTRKRKHSSNVAITSKVFVAANETFGKNWQYIISDDKKIANPTTLVGNKIWNVVYEDTDSARITVLENQVKQLLEIVALQNERISFLEKENAEFKIDIEDIYHQRIIITAAELVLFMFGNQPPDTIQTAKYNFSKFKECNRRLGQYNLSFDGAKLTIKKLNEISNKIIDNRNFKVTHFADLDALKDSIDKSIRFFRRYPMLVTKYPEEYFMITNYEKFKSAFKLK
ncbi:MAG: hypothetical protein ACRCZI_05775 [Cetobacterium sp.]